MNSQQTPTWIPTTPAPQKQKSNKGKYAVAGIAVTVGLFAIAGLMGGAQDEAGDKTTTAPAPVTTQAAAKPAAPKAKPAHKTTYATFKVWGTAPAGALGPLDITYGSDVDHLTGKFKNGKFSATVVVKNDKLWYNVSAQLQGSGDIHCSVTVDGKTKSGRAMGGYNICSVQLSNVWGSWS